MKKNNSPVTNIGLISLMMIFIVLCMVIFAVLSLSSAIAADRTGQKNADHTTEYYDASNKAEEILADMDDIFSDSYQKANNTEDYYRSILERLPDTVNAIQTDGQIEASYQTDVNDSQALFVRIAALPFQEIQEKENYSFYKILTWQVIQKDSWEGDNTIQLIQ